GNVLHISDMHELRNESSPPRTQFGGATFDVYLPQDARLQSVLAASPGNGFVTISASHVLKESGHYGVTFPLRPGATKFAFNYELPYDGHALFEPRRGYPLQQLAVMLPPAMKFSSASRAFAPLPVTNPNYQVIAANFLGPGQGPAFLVSGFGELPLLESK